ncbi:receptor-like protein 6 [Rutidosis leptorrhynchoides]|uniref:receptor-like protein 6 n=1 Tax=Rutidosis leptorrhynchoides TaxID=125765 RepID=UPI003A99D757
MALKSMISFVYLFLFVLITSTPSSSLISHDEECLALFQFKQTILHQNYTTTSFLGGFQKLDSWRKTTISNTSDNVFDCCSWLGVVCSRNEGHVIELDLSQSSIHGLLTSNSTLFNLVHLLKLNLSMNYFTESQIPSEIALLKQLKSLDLSNSVFSGKIPNEISHLTQLSLLDLSFNSLKLQTPSLLQNLTRLETLHLIQVNISSSVPRFLVNFSSLTTIKFGGCQLQGKFPIAIFHLPKLKLLSLSLNPDLTGSLPEFRNNTLLEYLNLFTTGFFGMIPESISNLNHLVSLDLANSYFSGSIPGSVSNLTQLTRSILSQNEFTGPVPSLASLSKIRELDLSENNFETSSEYGWIGKLISLEKLWLDGMNIYHEILPYFANLTNLGVVAVPNNFIPGRIPSSFMNLTQLTYVDLYYNRLNGPIPSAFSNFKKLIFLDLSGNKFNGSVDLDTFIGLENLEVLRLEGISVVTTDNNTDGTLLPELKDLQLTSCDLKEFPAFLRFQKEMTSLRLNMNKIGGLIPAWIFKNSQKTMYFIDLSDNFITGEIPPLICQAESLRLIDLSSNSFTGTLPTCFFGNFTKPMFFINLSQNKFHGEILNTFSYESQLAQLYLDENQFSGQLPKSLANCTNLQVLSVADNCFDGVFPFWLGTLTKLQVLDLSSNRFSGAIHDPSTFIPEFEFPQLQMLILSNNDFSGHLPDNYFKILNAMKSSTIGFDNGFRTGGSDKPSKILNSYALIDLSCNSFDGDIPQSLTDLQGLGSLNLSNNHLTGYVLPSFGNLTNLESLDLSHNELSGEIPPQLVQLNFLAKFNVSFNNLEGRAPTGKQFNTFENYSYVGNHLLCGKPLSNDCQHSTISTLPQTSDEYYKSLFPSDIIDWIVVFTGFGSGLVIGIFLWNLVYGRYRDWFIERFGMREDTWVKPLRNTRRS